MIGLDTNVIVRYVMQDDPAQAHLATEFIEGRLSIDAPGFLTMYTRRTWVFGKARGAYVPKSRGWTCRNWQI